MKENNYKAKAEGIATIVVRTEGQKIDCSCALVSATVFEAFGRIAAAELVFNDGGFSYNDFAILDSDTFLPGKALTIDIGYDSDVTTVFSGTVTGHQIKLSQGESKLVVTVRHDAFKMTLGRKTARFENMTDSDILSEISGKYGIPCVTDTTKVVHQSMVQHNVTDWDFINMRAEAAGLLLLSSVDGLSVKKPALDSTPILTIDSSFSVYELEASLDARKPFSSYRINAWNYSTQEIDSETLPTGKYDTEAGDSSSKEIASQMQNDELVINLGTYQENPDAMKAAVEAEVMRANLSKITGKVTIPGYASIHPGDMITLEKAGGRVNGKIMVSSVSHEVSSQGWQTTLCFGLDNARYAERYDDICTRKADCAVPGINGLQVAKVEQLSGDPSGEERILLRFPSDSDMTVWARVAHSERGAFFLPEVGDEVVTGFMNSDPGKPIVLGMLHSSGTPEPEELKDENDIKGVYSRENLKVVFDDGKKSVSITTPRGNSFAISDEDKGISIKDQNGNSLVLDQNGIALKDCNGNSIKMESSGITVESASLLTLKAGQTMTIKGTLVQIN